MATLGQAVDALTQTVASRVGADPTSSYTAQLLAAGPAKCAKKLGEEAVEAALACVSGDKAAMAEEAADVLFHLAVAIQAAGVRPEEVAAVLERRQGTSGLAEKASRQS